MAEPTLQNSQRSQQVATKQDTQKSYKDLEEWEQFAVDLYVVWTPYKTIVSELVTDFQHKITAQGLRRCFMKEGRLYLAAEERKKERIAERSKNKEEVLKQLEEGATEAVGVVRAAARGEKVEEQQLNAAKDILDRTGYPKTSKIDANGKFESEGLTVVASGIKAILERRPGVPSRIPTRNG